MGQNADGMMNDILNGDQQQNGRILQIEHEVIHDQPRPVQAMINENVQQNPNNHQQVNDQVEANAVPAPNLIDDDDGFNSLFTVKQHKLDQMIILMMRTCAGFSAS